MSNKIHLINEHINYGYSCQPVAPQIQWDDNPLQKTPICGFLPSRHERYVLYVWNQKTLTSVYYFRNIYCVAICETITHMV